MNIILLVSTLLLFVFTQGGVKKCYSCKDVECKNLEEVICDSDENSTTEYLCVASSYTTILYTGAPRVDSSRKCEVDTEQTKESCRQYNEKEAGTCYTCDTDLCNKIIQPVEDIKNEKTEPATTTTEGNFKECYSCKGDDCASPRREKCKIEDITDYLCQAMAGTKNGITKHVKRCVANTEDTKKGCEVANERENYACYTCETDLCNDKDPISEKNKHQDTTTTSDVPVNMNGVKECYSCPMGSCEDSKAISCDTIKSKYLCQGIYFYQNDDTKVRERQCVEESREVIFSCTNFSLQSFNQHCYTCNENLCNDDDLHLKFDEDDDASAEKCYFCHGACEDPEIQICHIENYICQEKKVTEDGETTYEKTCVQNTDQARKQCEFYNEQPGSSCYTCDTDRCNDKYLPVAVENVSSTSYPALAMLLATLLSLFLTKL